MSPSLLHRSITYVDPDGAPISVPLLECNLYCCIDSSGGADVETATALTDKVGWCVCAVDVRGHWLILELDAAYLSDEQFIQKLYELEDKYAPRFAIEAMPHLESVMRALFTRQGRHIRYVPLKHGRRNKNDRIVRLRPMLRYVHFLEEIRASAQYLLRHWYVGQVHGDDALDAFAYMLDIARAPGVEDIADRKRQVEKNLQVAALARLPQQDREECQRWLDFDARQGRRHLNDDMKDFLGLS